MAVILFRASGVDAETPLLKATVLKTIMVPAYTRADGTTVPAHQARVHVNPDVPQSEVLAGRGSYTQRQAHARMERRVQNWHQHSDEEKHAIILEHATADQKSRSAAAARSVRSRSGRGDAAVPLRAPASMAPAQVQDQSSDAHPVADPPAPMPPSVVAVVADHAPPAEPLATDQLTQALASAMQAVPVHGLLLRRSPGQSRRNRLSVERDLGRLREFAAQGDVTQIANYPLAPSLLLASYRAQLLAAARTTLETQYATAATAATPGSIPPPPQLSGRNMQNSSLVGCQNRINLMHRIATTSAEPVRALLSIHSYRGNGYANAADDYRAALLAHYGHDVAGGAIQEGVTPRPVGQRTRRARAAAPVPAANPAASTAPAPVPHVTEDPSIAANPLAETVSALGFVPRPSVPLEWTVAVNGVTIPNRGTVPWPHPRMAELARLYMGQATALQTRARNYQLRSGQEPQLRDHPGFAPPQVSPAARARDMAAQRAATTAFMSQLAALPDIHRPHAPVGGNILSYPAPASLESFGQKLGVSGAAAKEVIGRLVADYGSGVKFRISVNGASVKFYGDDGTLITREFRRDRADNLTVYHALFQAGTQGAGGSKALFRTSVGVYDVLGVKRVDVFADISVGGYCWAKYGFKCSQNDWDDLRDRFQRKVSTGVLTNSADGSTYPLAPEVKDKLERILADPNPYALHQLADTVVGGQKIGADLLLGTNWHGSLDLTDDYQRRRTLLYCAEAPSSTRPRRR